MISYKILFALSFAVVLAACGGGGGSSPSTPPGPVAPPSPPPPPPPPSNMAPNLAWEINPQPALENEPFFIDASNSADPDGQIVRSTVTQLCCTYFVAEPVIDTVAGTGQLEFVAPEVFFHERPDSTGARAAFEIEIEDNEGSVVKERVEVAFESVLDPVRNDGISNFYTLEPTEEVVLYADNRPTGSFSFLYGTRPTSTDPQSNEQILLIDELEGGFPPSFEAPVTPLSDTIPSRGTFFPGVFSFDLDPGTRQQFAIINTVQNEINWFAAFEPTEPKLFELDSKIDINAPCHVAGRTNSGQDVIVVGQKNGGLSVVRLLPDRPLGFRHNGFDSVIVSNTASTRSLCFIYPTRIPASRGRPIELSQLDDLIAIDYDQNELVLLADYEEPAETYEVIETIPIDTDGLSNLKIVDVTSVGGPGSGPNLIWILMSDGIDGGEHRLILVWQDQGDVINQRTHKFVGGAPNAMHTFMFFPPEPSRLIDTSADVVIVSYTTSELTIFEDDGNNVNPNQLTPIPTYKDPIYFDIGDIPVSSSLLALPLVNGANISQVGLVLSFRNQIGLRVFTYMD